MIFSGIQGIIFLLSLQCYIFLLVIEYKSIFSLIKKIPGWLILFNGALLIYRIFFIPHIYGSRSHFGTWILGMAKSESFASVLTGDRSPVYFFIIKIFSFIFGGVDFSFIVNFNNFLFFINIFSIYLIVCLLFKDRVVAALASLFFAISPIVFIFSMNEDYTNPAIFFSIQSLLFALIYITKKQHSFLFLAIAASLLSAGSRPEYIIFSVPFLLFLLIFVDFKKYLHKLYLIALYTVLVLPRSIIVFENFQSTVMVDPLMHGQYVGSGITFFRSLYNHHNIFIANLTDNISAILMVKTLMGVFVFMSFLLFLGGYKKNRKAVFYFVFYFIVFFLYYCYLHNEGVYESYKYISSLVFPLVILAALGVSKIFKKYSKLSSVLLVSISIFSLYATSPAINNKFGYNRYDTDHANEFYVGIMREYMMFREHKNVIDSNDNSIFISNGNMTMLYSAIPIKENGVFPVTTKYQLERTIAEMTNKEKIYVSQGELGFGPYTPDHYTNIIPAEFEKSVLELLELDKEIFSYFNENDHHIFLYQMSQKNNI